MPLESRTPPSTLSAAVPTDIHLGDVGVRGLPAELWLQIFAMGKRLDDTSLFANATQENGHIDSVSAVSHTCSYFRELAINSPILWTSIRFDDTCSMSNIRLRILRSHPLMLDIAIYLLDESVGPAPGLDWKSVDTFMDIVMDEIDKWRSLRIRLMVERAGHPVIMRLRDRLALNLEYLSISVRFREPGSIPSEPHIFNHGAPRLISAKLRGVAHTFYRPPLADLTTLRLEGIGNLSMGFDALVRVITQPPNLRNLLIRKDIVPPDRWALRKRGSIPLPELRSLHIYSESGAIYAGFLLAMDAPQLSALTLEDAFDKDLDPLWEQATPDQFQSLRRLTVPTEDHISSTTYVKICRLFPNVTEYTTCRGTPSTSQLFRLLRTPRRDDEEPVLLWPGLQTLRLASDLLEEEDSMDRVQQLLDTRVTAGCPLRQVCFFRSDDLDWMSDDEWSALLQDPVQVVGYIDVLPGDSVYIDIDDIAV
ncbi:hypothetical protein D9619_004854 [Psilocybe cf. subviscida]|uniref:F-box domain-containing protein n=1 Tax=Psilocybe cf. subviscida TaxID=2480587 RepID=A0A8H5F8R6_9AGAR|nr:hypothetical protein D9619_004854 [Psilocybe cf. subviscida]